MKTFKHQLCNRASRSIDEAVHTECNKSDASKSMMKSWLIKVQFSALLTNCNTEHMIGYMYLVSPAGSGSKALSRLCVHLFLFQPFPSIHPFYIIPVATAEYHGMAISLRISGSSAITQDAAGHKDITI